MPNYTSAWYRFEGGYEVWALDCQKGKVTKEIKRLGDEMAALRKAERKEINYLVQRYQDESLNKLKRGGRDYRISRKLRSIWEKLEEAKEQMISCARDLQTLCEISEYRNI